MPFHPQGTRRIALHREAGLYALTGAGAVLHSPDFGRRWQRLSAVPLPRGAAVRDLVIDAARRLLRLWRPEAEDDVETFSLPLSPSSLPLDATLFGMSPDGRWVAIAPVRRPVWPDAPRLRTWGSPTYQEIWLGDLRGERPRWTRLRAGRFGPAGLHPDERLPSERDRRLGSWPSRGLATQSRDELLESCAASSGRDRRKRSGG
ncbi:MAG TPA: hypothetical protein VGG06_25935 [Thermoanaerobaculia bacterium]